jgi:hypothetical protein
MVLKGVTTASIAMTLVITREVDKNVTALVAVVGTIQNQTGKVVAALVAATATILNHIIRAANLTATVVANALAPIAQATGGVLKTQAITASVAALGTIKKQAMKNITVVLAAPTLILRKQVQLHIFPVAMIVATVTNGVAKRMIASVALVAPGPIGRFGLHFAQVMSTTVHMVAHLRECFSLRAHRHDPGAGLPLEAEDPDTVLTAHPHDSGCQE